MALGKRALAALQKPIDVISLERQMADALGTLISDRTRCEKIASWEMYSSKHMIFSLNYEGSWGQHASYMGRLIDATIELLAYSRTKILTEIDKDGSFFDEEIWRLSKQLEPALDRLQSHLIKEQVEANAVNREEVAARPAYRKGALYVRLDQLADRWASLGGIVSAGTAFKPFAIAATAPLWGSDKFPSRALTTAIGNFKKRHGEPSKPGNPLITQKAMKREKL